MKETSESVPSPRWVQRPDGSNWGEFGSDDRIGRLNLITPQRRKAAALEAREGLAFCLSLPLDVGAGLNETRPAPRIAPLRLGGAPKLNLCACEAIRPGLTDVVCDDEVTLSTQYSTQWDGLCHMGSLFDADGDGVPEVRYYNGFAAITAMADNPLGIQHMAATGVQGRGVMVDLRAHFGAGRTVVNHRMLMEVLRADEVVIEEGDLVCLHTGFAQALLDGARDPAQLEQTGAVLDGFDPALLEWLTESRLAALIADNVAVEARAVRQPDSYRGPLLPLHEHCLFKQGIHLGEMWHLTPLADWLRVHRRSRFFLTAPALRLPGAAGSPVTPVATV